MEPVNAAIIYYSATGIVHALAQAAAEGADKAGARVRLRKVAETAHRRRSATTRPGPSLQDTAGVAEASSDDLAWAERSCSAPRLGSATRPASSARSSTPPADCGGAGTLADEVYTAFTANLTAHGGQESTLLAPANTFYHWGGIIVPRRSPVAHRPARSKAGRGRYDCWPNPREDDVISCLIGHPRTTKVGRTCRSS